MNSTTRWSLAVTVGLALALLAACCKVIHVTEPSHTPSTPAPAAAPAPLPPPPPPPPPQFTSYVPPSYTAAPEVRVWLSDLPESFEISCAGECSIIFTPGETRKVARLGPVKLSRIKEGFQLGTEQLKVQRLEFQPLGNAPLKVGNKSYPGAIRIIRAGQGMAAINLLNIEQYLLGVLGAEMPADWHMEALKAQAVAARSYALASLLQRKNQEWDLTSTVEDQVYSGGTPQKSIRDAVTATRGIYLT